MEKTIKAIEPAKKLTQSMTAPIAGLTTSTNAAISAIKIRFNDACDARESNIEKVT